MTTVTRRILTFQPLIYDGEERFLKTNLGALVTALRGLGHNAAQVLLCRENNTVAARDDLILATSDQTKDPNWWKDQAPWAVISNTWGANRHRASRRAILQATERLVERLDTDGIRSPCVDPMLYYYNLWSVYRDFRPYTWQHILAPVYPIFEIAYHTFRPGRRDGPMAAGIAELPAVTVESPIAAERIRRFLRYFGHTGNNIHLSPFPISDSGVIAQKEKLVVAVGRWESHQKNFPLMLKVLNSFLYSRPDWRAKLFGSTPHDAKHRLKQYCANTQNRISLAGQTSHENINREYSRAMIFLMTSRREGSPISAAEALCCGCSVVGPAHLASFPWFCGQTSGTVASSYTKLSLLDALNAESNEWLRGARDPRSIARNWRLQISSKSVATNLYELLNGFHSSTE